MNKVLFITGPTASGKTSLAIKIAKKFNGEIISADSRAIYRGIDIASAKPSLEERDGVIHWGFDIVNVGERFTAYDYQQYAYKKIEDILSRSKLPIVIGGTGLYIDSLLYNYQFSSEPNYKLRDSLENKSLEYLVEYCNKNNINMPENKKNKRYIIRAIEKQGYKNNGKKDNDFTSITVGITTDRSVLKDRIVKRNREFVKLGIIEETICLSNKFGWDNESMTANAYPLIRKYLDNEIDLEKLIELMSIRDWQLAKRQITFMKRNKKIHWLQLEEAEAFIEKELS